MAVFQTVSDDLLRALISMDKDSPSGYVYRIYIQPLVKCARIYRVSRDMTRSLHRDHTPPSGNYVLVGLHRHTRELILTFRTDLGNDMIDTHSTIKYSDNEMEIVRQNASEFLINAVIPSPTEGYEK